ncbi:MAG: hypothetical protein AB8G96_11400 [Phycisphaerales bacterium]
MLSLDQLIDHVMELNPTASREFLARFDRREVQEYLEHLQLTTEPRGSHSAWVRPDGSRAVITRTPAA